MEQEETGNAGQMSSVKAEIIQEPKISDFSCGPQSRSSKELEMGEAEVLIDCLNKGPKCSAISGR